MSTRCSFFYKDGLHAYWECNSGNLCLEFVGVHFKGEPGVPTKIDRNQRYGDPYFSKETWREFANAILKELDERSDEIVDPMTESREK